MLRAGGVDKVKDKIDKLLDSLSDNKKTIFIALMVIFGALTYGLYHCRGIMQLEDIYYSAQAVSSAFVVAGVVFAGLQYYASGREAKKQRMMKRTQKAIDLAEYYNKNILQKYPPIRFIYTETGMMNCIKQANVNNMNEFDMDEVKKLYSQDTIEKMSRIFRSNDFVKAILNSDIIYNFDLKKDFNIESESDKDKITPDSKEFKKLASTFLNEYVSGTLNNLEFFAMHFTYDTAAEDVVYQSLHQSYLEIVQVLYYNISKINKDSPSKYYTNVISLYQTWKNCEDKVKEEKTKQGISLIRRGEKCND